jgi:hypothetical protein
MAHESTLFALFSTNEPTNEPTKTRETDEQTHRSGSNRRTNPRFCKRTQADRMPQVRHLYLAFSVGCGVVIQRRSSVRATARRCSNPSNGGMVERPRAVLDRWPGVRIKCPFLVLGNVELAAWPRLLLRVRRQSPASRPSARPAPGGFLARADTAAIAVVNGSD